MQAMTHGRAVPRQRSSHAGAGLDRDRDRSWAKQAAVVVITAFVVVVSASRSGDAQSSDPRDPLYNAAVDGTHEDGTLGTTSGFWQQLRDSSASRALTQIVGPGDGNIWTTIAGVQYVQMSTIIDATSAAFFAGRNPGELITAPIPSGQPGDVFDIDGIWLTPGNDLTNYLLARRNEWGPGTGTTAAERATQVVGGPLSAAWIYQVSLWVEPTLLFRPAVQWSIADGTILQTADHLSWNDLLAQGFDVDQIAGQRAGPGFVLTDPGNATLQTALTFSEVTGGSDYASASADAGNDVNEWFNGWWNNSRGTGDGGSFPFPWTALGFTYDWYYQDKAGGDLAGVIGRSGLSEFVFPQNFAGGTLFPYRLAVGPRLIDVALAVPEIDPHAFGTTVAALIGALGLLERRLRRLRRCGVGQTEPTSRE